MSTISPSQAHRPLVVALDVGTSSSRAVLFDAQGRAVEGIESRTAYRMTTTPDGGVEMDADELFAIVCRNLDELLNRAGSLAGEISAVGACTFWHSLLGVDGEGNAVTPIYNWSDTRSSADAKLLAERSGAQRIHKRTGAMPHASYYPAKILWLKRTNPALYKKASRWMSFGEYFYLKIFNHTLASISMASGTGLLNLVTCDWDAEMLEAVGIEPNNLSPIAADDHTLVGLNDEYVRRWTALAQIPWMPAVGDGATNNIGSGCVSRDRAALMVGTSGAMRVCWKADRVSVPRGLWCYRANRDYVVMGGALSDGGSVYEWGQRVLGLESSGQTKNRQEESSIEKRLTALEPDGHGLTVLPFFSGERSTGWADYARAAIVGMSLDTEAIEILRAMLEAVAYRFRDVYELLREEIPGITRIVASGGGLLRSPVWTQMMADAIGVPIVASAVQEASSRGAAILALHALGHIRDLGEVQAPTGEVYEPDGRNRERYERGRKRQQVLYERLIAPGPDALDACE